MEALMCYLISGKKMKLSKTEVSKMFLKCYLYATCEACIMCATTLLFLDNEAPSVVAAIPYSLHEIDVMPKYMIYLEPKTTQDNNFK
ncbi:hypothetical protein R6Q59_012783 [Mikania micrantha]